MTNKALLTAWRLSTAQSLQKAFAQPKAGRWHYSGIELLYCSSSPALAMLECRAHHCIGQSGYVMSRVTLELEPELISCIEESVLPDNWRQDNALTRSIGKAWYEKAEFPVLQVPSVMCPIDFNLLIHPEFAKYLKLEMKQLMPIRMDRRLITAPSGRY